MHRIRTKKINTVSESLKLQRHQECESETESEAATKFKTNSQDNNYPNQLPQLTRKIY